MHQGVFYCVKALFFSHLLFGMTQFFSSFRLLNFEHSHTRLRAWQCYFGRQQLNFSFFIPLGVLLVPMTIHSRDTAVWENIVLLNKAKPPSLSLSLTFFLPGIIHVIQFIIIYLLFWLFILLLLLINNIHIIIIIRWRRAKRKQQWSMSPSSLKCVRWLSGQNCKDLGRCSSKCQ